MVRLLHLMAIWIGTSMVPRFWRRRDWTQPRTGRKSLISLAQPQEWESERLRQESLYNSSHELFCHVLGLGIGINYVYSGRTAFTTFLSSYLQDFGQWGRKFLVSTLTTPLRKWLADLQAHGVNLVEWGEKEHKLWGSGRIHREIPLSHEYGLYAPRIRLCGFSYGPFPSDWFVWLSEPTDYLLADFWRSIETNVEVMPGSWPEESFDREDYEIYDYE
jgi:hypothetical protein